MSEPELPWRGPGPDRPDLRLPPDRMRFRRRGRMLKQWMYVAAFADEFMLCAARVQVGPLGQTFWAIYDREADEMHERTRLRPPGARGEVFTEDDRVRIMVGREVRANIRPGDARAVESVCETSEGGYMWTRKRADVPFQCDVRFDDRRWQVDARGVRDESAGYHPRHTVWSWSAGVGTSADGRSVGWNLVSGINDPPRNSERAIWVNGEPWEPGPVEFEDLDAVAFEGGERLDFEPDCERAAEESKPFVRYSYRQPMGRFTGTLPGGIELRRGLGVMEHHDAVW